RTPGATGVYAPEVIQIEGGAGKAPPAGPPVAGPGVVVKEVVSGDAPCAEGEDGKPGAPRGFDWTKVPPIEVMPRPGNFVIYPYPPTGPGYYSLRDLLEGNYRQKPPVFPYPPFAITANSTFNYDFRYLDKPDNTQHDLFDPLKRIHLG